MAHYREALVTTLVIWASSNSGHRWTNLIGFLWIHFWFCVGSTSMFVQGLTSEFRLVIDLNVTASSSNCSHMCVLLWTRLTYPWRRMSIKKKERKKEKKDKNKLTWPRLKPEGEGTNIALGTQSVRSCEVLYKYSFNAHQETVKFSVYNLLCTVNTCTYFINFLSYIRRVSRLVHKLCHNQVLFWSQFSNNKRCSFWPVCILHQSVFSAILYNYSKVGTCSQRLPFIWIKFFSIVCLYVSYASYASPHHESYVWNT